MKWQMLPGPASFFDSVIELLRNGTNVIVPAPNRSASRIEEGICDLLKDDHWQFKRLAVQAQADPLTLVTEGLYIEPNNWVQWSAEHLCQELGGNFVVVLEGIDATLWDTWRVFLKEFEVASRQRPSDDRPLLLVVAKGVSPKHIQISGGALEVRPWIGVLSELDTLIFVDQLLRSRNKLAKHHKLIVRQISALALWDLDLATYLAAQPEASLFNAVEVLQEARAELDKDCSLKEASWENGGSDHIDGAEMTHPFVLVDKGDPGRELKRRLWTAQAAELLPLIEIRRRELLKGLERHLACPLSLDGISITSLEELEIGRLAYAAQKYGLKGELRDRAELLAGCRNKLAHLTALRSDEAMGSWMYA